MISSHTKCCSSWGYCCFPLLTLRWENTSAEKKFSKKDKRSLGEKVLHTLKYTFQRRRHELLRLSPGTLYGCDGIMNTKGKDDVMMILCLFKKVGRRYCKSGVGRIQVFIQNTRVSKLPKGTLYGCDGIFDTKREYNNVVSVVCLYAKYE
ncbi:hypothetical protein OSTOST_05251 [Ostertagia ostertagi]